MSAKNTLPEAGNQKLETRNWKPEAGNQKLETRTRKLETAPLPQILGRLLQIVRPAQITPIVLVSSKSEDVLVLSGQMQIRGDDGKNSFFRHQRDKARRNHVDPA